MSNPLEHAALWSDIGLPFVWGGLVGLVFCWSVWREASSGQQTTGQVLPFDAKDKT